ncbi:minor tail protein [Mycobacterium phage MalagasyRose]|uniref:Minor tail protein n=1 Tax=Mycobacterium phage MalagasyRose TaxID=2599870 RepID=A0A5J6TDG8_9CAUD|nr:minor tail protein [Mycobacterium phage MalagasyRose]QFG08876.1 minor tail protein [Mycobacterium phage MalagasyRose]
MTDVITPQLGDKVFLKTITAQLNIFGVISDLDTPDQVSATLELFGGNGVMSLAALMGPPGPAGSNAPLPKLQPDVYTDPDQLPNTLTDDDVDVGKYWIIEDKDDEGNVLGSKAYLWHGDHWQVFMMGSPGPAGPVPIITPNVVLLDPDDDDLSSYITVTGSDFNPTWTLYLKAPRGPQGPAATIGNATDVDHTVVPEDYDVLTYVGGLWRPRAQGTIMPKFYTMPESSFTNNSGLGTVLPIGAFAIPPQDWDWIPVVHGHIRAQGIEVDADPLMIGCEVRLGHPDTGQLVARGWGNITEWTNLVPHFSTNTSIGDAAAPGNGRGVVPAGHSGNEGTLYVRLYNDGVGGAYNFNRKGAQLSITVMPAYAAAG